MLVNGKTIEEILRENDEKMKTKKEHMKLFDINKKLVNTYINYDKENNTKKDLRDYLNKFYDKAINNQLNLKNENQKKKEYENINSNRKKSNQYKTIEYNKEDLSKRLYPHLFKKKDLIKKKIKSMNNIVLKNKSKQKNKTTRQSFSINIKNINPVKVKKRISKRNIPLKFNYSKTMNLNINKPSNFFQKRIMNSRKIDGKTDNVTLYHMHNSEWSKNYILNEMKQNEKLSYGYINYCPYI